MCTVLVMRFRDFGFYISEPANLHAVKSRAIAARISPFILLSNVLSLRQGRGILSKEFKPELFRHLISCIRCQTHGSEIGFESLNLRSRKERFESLGTFQLYSRIAQLFDFGTLINVNGSTLKECRHFRQRIRRWQFVFIGEIE